MCETPHKNTNQLDTTDSDRQLIGPENWKQTAQNLHQWFIQVKRSIAILSKCLNSSMVLQAVLVL